MEKILKQLRTIGLIPVVCIDNAENAVPLAKALKLGGLPAAEITFRTPAAEESIARIAKAEPDLLLGAGTVLTPEQADRAIRAGARFLVSPGLNPSLVKYCLDQGYPLLPGISNPSDVEQGLELGLHALKFFPAEAAGGMAMLKALSAPYRDLSFMPTGGINEQNLRTYLDFERVIACGGSWMVPAESIRKGEFESIVRRTQSAVQAMLGFKMVHLGINAQNESDAKEAADRFSGLFGFPIRELPVSFFAGNEIEVMKAAGEGPMGHLAIGTYDVPRAAAYLERGGMALRRDTAAYDEKGALRFIYLKEEIAGFAVHLVKREGD